MIQTSNQKSTSPKALSHAEFNRALSLYAQWLIYRSPDVTTSRPEERMAFWGHLFKIVAAGLAPLLASLMIACWILVVVVLPDLKMNEMMIWEAFPLLSVLTISLTILTAWLASACYGKFRRNRFTRRAAKLQNRALCQVLGDESGFNDQQAFKKLCHSCPDGFNARAWTDSAYYSNLPRFLQLIDYLNSPSHQRSEAPWLRSPNALFAAKFGGWPMASDYQCAMAVQLVGAYLVSALTLPFMLALLFCWNDSYGQLKYTTAKRIPLAITAAQTTALESYQPQTNYQYLTAESLKLRNRESLRNLGSVNLPQHPYNSAYELMLYYTSVQASTTMINEEERVILVFHGYEKNAGPWVNIPQGTRMREAFDIYALHHEFAHLGEWRSDYSWAHQAKIDEKKATEESLVPAEMQVSNHKVLSFEALARPPHRWVTRPNSFDESLADMIGLMAAGNLLNLSQAEYRTFWLDTVQPQRRTTLSFEHNTADFLKFAHRYVLPHYDALMAQSVTEQIVMAKQLTECFYLTINCRADFPLRDEDYHQWMKFQDLLLTPRSDWEALPDAMRKVQAAFLGD